MRHEQELEADDPKEQQRQRRIEQMVGEREGALLFDEAKLLELRTEVNERERNRLRREANNIAEELKNLQLQKMLRRQQRSDRRQGLGSNQDEF